MGSCMLYSAYYSFVPFRDTIVDMIDPVHEKELLENVKIRGKRIKKSVVCVLEQDSNQGRDYGLSIVSAALIWQRWEKGVTPPLISF